VAPSHAHVIVATGFPPCMVHVRVTLLPSIIGPAGVCVIVGDKYVHVQDDIYYGQVKTQNNTT
jgi:hypothetical protein